jgi:hypothetical protein
MTNAQAGLVQTGRCQGINFVEDGFEMWSRDVVAFDFPKYHFCIATVELMNGQLAFRPMQVHRYRRCTPLFTPQYIAVKPLGLDNIIAQY